MTDMEIVKTKIDRRSKAYRDSRLAVAEDIHPTREHRPHTVVNVTTRGDNPGVEVVDDMRRDMRPKVREDDPRAAADKRAQQILSQLGDSIDEPDAFHIPQELIPDGWDYNWKRYFASNKEDTTHINKCLQTGWSFVPATRPGHGIFLPTGWKEANIIKDGMVLMERPQTITDLVNKRMLQEAKNQVKIKDDQLNSKLPAGMDRSNKGASLDKLRRTIEGPIPNN